MLPILEIQQLQTIIMTTLHPSQIAQAVTMITTPASSIDRPSGWILTTYLTLVDKLGSILDWIETDKM